MSTATGTCVSFAIASIFALYASALDVMFDRFASIFALYASALDVMFDRFARVFCKVACSSAFVAFSSTIFALSAAIVTLFF